MMPGRLFWHGWAGKQAAKLILVNQFWVTLEDKEGTRTSEPLEKLMLTYDDQNDRLKIIVRY